MTLRKKIILSNILTVILPIILILMIWAGYVHLGNGAYLKQINRASDGGDLLTEAMNVLYTYEAELSDMHWDVAVFPDENETDIVVSPEKERIEELKSLGYHIQVETANGISFSNMDASDKLVLDGTGTKTEGAVFWSGSNLIIQDSFRISGQDYYLTAVYNEHRADTGVQSSLLPMYMVSPTVLFIFLAIAVLCIVFTSVMVARWMNRSVLIPLDELKKGADMIAGGYYADIGIIPQRFPYWRMISFSSISVSVLNRQIHSLVLARFGRYTSLTGIRSMILFFSLTRRFTFTLSFHAAFPRRLLLMV